MRVLCGTDFSPASLDAGNIAALWALRTGGELHLIHAVPRAGGLDLPREALLAERERLRVIGGSVHATDLVVGDAEEVLAEEAVARRADLVVVGAVGRRGLRGRRAGTTADSTARDAPIPVLVVREPGLLEPWLRGLGSVRAVVGYEPGAGSLAAVRWTADLASLGPLDLRVISLVLPGPENRAAQATGPGLGLTLRPEVRTQLEAQLREAIAPCIGNCEATVLIRESLGRRDIPLVHEAETAQAAFLVVGSHQRRGFQRWWTGSVSSGVLHAASTNVVVVPSPGP